jgi:hypothetical protein
MEVSATPAPEEKLISEDIKNPEKPKIVKLKKSRKHKKPPVSFVIEEDDESEPELEPEKQIDKKTEEFEEFEEFELPPKKIKKKSKKNGQKVKVNPIKKTRKNKLEVELVEVSNSSS